MEHIFSMWPSIAALASDLKKPYPTVSAWKQRGSIPARYDLDLVRAAEKRGHVLSLEQLAQARAAAPECDHPECRPPGDSDAPEHSLAPDRSDAA